MTRRLWLRSIGASSLAWAQTGGRPSVALLIVDPGAALPAGFSQFLRAYAANPEPGPALASILTARFPTATGVVRDGVALAEPERCLAAELTRAGYRTVYAGPWPLDNAGPDRRGFARWLPDPDANLAGARPFFLHIDARGRDPGAVVRRVAGVSDLAVLVSLHGRETASPMEPSSRVALAMSGAAESVLRVDSLISHVDLMPTVLGICGVATPAGVHGRDLSGARAESVFVQGALGSAAEWRMVVRGLDKLVVDARLEVTHLYNLGQDPGEENNLAADPSHQRTRDELKAHLAQWMRRAGDRMDPSGLKVRG